MLASARHRLLANAEMAGNHSDTPVLYRGGRTSRGICGQVSTFSLNSCPNSIRRGRRCNKSRFYHPARDCPRLRQSSASLREGKSTRATALRQPQRCTLRKAFQVRATFSTQEPGLRQPQKCLDEHLLKLDSETCRVACEGYGLCASHCIRDPGGKRKHDRTYRTPFT